MKALSGGAGVAGVAAISLAQEEEKKEEVNPEPEKHANGFDPFTKKQPQYK